MKILVCGDRHWADIQMIEDVLAGYARSSREPITIIHGAARGADALAGIAARGLGMKVKEFPAEWSRYGRGAGPIRNQRMLKEQPDVVIAFHDHLDRSKGTRDMLDRANRAGIELRLFTHELGGRRAR